MMVVPLQAVMVVVPAVVDIEWCCVFFYDIWHEFDGLVVIIFQMVNTGLFRSCYNLETSFFLSFDCSILGMLLVMTYYLC